MKQIYLHYLIAFFILIATGKSNAQIAGQVIEPVSPMPAGLNPLDPDKDGWSTKRSACAASPANCPYLTNDHVESEVPWVAIPQYTAAPESAGDLLTGSTCGSTEIIDPPAASEPDASYVYFLNPDGILDNGDEYMLYRLRIANIPTGAFGFSILMDTDQKIGASDPNRVLGNAGFEIEIIVKSGGGAGVDIYNVDGRATNGILLRHYDLGAATQRVVALNKDAACSGTPMFYDFFVKLSDMGLFSYSYIRLGGATASSPGSALAGSASDVSNIQDNIIAGGSKTQKQDSLFVLLIDSYQAATIGSLTIGASGVFPTPVLLPVKLVSFNAERTDDKGVRLSWITTGQDKNTYFLVERSLDGNTYEMLKKVSPNYLENSNYHWVDEAPYTAGGYYRIRQVDNTGATRQSSAVYISGHRAKLQAKAFPNPVSNQALEIQVSVETTQEVRIELINSKGQISYQATESATGQTSLIIPKQYLKPDTYLLRMISATDIITKKIVVL